MDAVLLELGVEGGEVRELVVDAAVGDVLQIEVAESGVLIADERVELRRADACPAHDLRDAPELHAVGDLDLLLEVALGGEVEAACLDLLEGLERALLRVGAEALEDGGDGLLVDRAASAVVRSQVGRVDEADSLGAARAEHDERRLNHGIRCEYALGQGDHGLDEAVPGEVLSHRPVHAR